MTPAPQPSPGLGPLRRVLDALSTHAHRGRVVGRNGVFTFPECDFCALLPQAEATLAALSERPGEGEAMREAAAKAIPTSWLDPLLSGPVSALDGHGDWGCPDVERLLAALADRIRALPLPATPPRSPTGGEVAAIRAHHEWIVRNGAKEKTAIAEFQYQRGQLLAALTAAQAAQREAEGKVAALELMLASKIGPDWREALPYESELELKAVLDKERREFAAERQRADAAEGLVERLVEALKEQRHQMSHVSVDQAFAETMRRMIDAALPPTGGARAREEGLE